MFHKNLKHYLTIFGLMIASASFNVSAATLGWNPSDSFQNVGDVFTLTLTGDGFTNGTVGGGFTVGWDASVLSLDNVDLSIFPGSSVGSGPFDFNFITIDNVAGTANIDVNGFATVSSFNIGSFLFTAVNPGFSNTAISISNLNVWADSSFNLIDPQPGFTNGTVTVSSVPLPPSVLLFGSGLIGMITFGRRKIVAA
jgi:hypothetical protein